MICARLGAFARGRRARMTTTVPDEIRIAKPSIEAAYTAFEIAVQSHTGHAASGEGDGQRTVQQACERLQAAKDLLQPTRTDPVRGDGASQRHPSGMPAPFLKRVLRAPSYGDISDGQRCRTCASWMHPTRVAKLLASQQRQEMSPAPPSRCSRSLTSHSGERVPSLHLGSGC